MTKKKKSDEADAPVAETVNVSEPPPVDAPVPLVGRSAERAKENDAEAKKLAEELAEGFYWQIALPSQPSVAVECEKVEDAISLYNRWAGINGSDTPHSTEMVPAKGPRVYETDDGKILYGTSGKKGVASIALPPVVAPNSPEPAKQE